MTDRIAVVTGASRGIGREIARQLAEKGLRVLAASRDPDKAAAALTEPRIEHVALDVTDATSIAALAHRVRGGFDVLANNAGISMKGFDEHVARGTLDTNFYGPLRVTDALLPAMKQGGSVVMVSSGMGDLSGIGDGPRQRLAAESITRDELLALVEEFVRDVRDGVHAKRGWPTSAYRVSKASLNALTRIYAREHHALRINTVDPGWVRTDMGGSGAPRSVEKGAETIVWLAVTAPEISGKFFRDLNPIPF